jgi:hypothetical protein
MPRPRYYLPPGMRLPGHLSPSLGLYQCREGHGPDQAGGMCVGGPYYDQEPGWELTAAGWWVHLAQTSPAECQRLYPLDGTMVAIPHTPHAWQIPHLLQVGKTGLECAVDPVLTDQGWQPPAHLRPVIAALREAIDHAEAWAADDEPRLIRLCVDLIAVNYDLELTEIIAAGWLTQAMIPRIIRAASQLGGDAA